MTNPQTRDEDVSLTRVDAPFSYRYDARPPRGICLLPAQSKLSCVRIIGMSEQGGSPADATAPIATHLPGRR